MIYSYLLVIIITSANGEILPAPERITNGNECLSENFPYVVSVRVGPRKIHICGGSLLDGYNVLTAAHCYLKNVRYYVVAGQTHFLNYTKEIQIQPVIHMFVHPNYSNNTTTNDIAILRLKSEIRETQLTKYVKLPAKEGPPSCEALQTAGWGRLIDKDITKLLPMNLRCVTLPVISLEECMSYYENIRLNSSFCTIDDMSGRGVCFGDSGGPLMCQNVQYGVISWGVRCFGPLPQVHTNVSAYTDFIHEIVQTPYTADSGYPKLCAVLIVVCNLLYYLLS